MHNKNKRGSDNKTSLGSLKSSPKRLKLEKMGYNSDNNHRDKPCCSKSLSDTCISEKYGENSDNHSMNGEKDGENNNNTKISGKGTTFKQLPQSSKSVDDEDDVIQHILELSKHEF